MNPFKKEIIEAERILQSEFKFKPERSKTIYYNINPWNRLIPKNTKKIKKGEEIPSKFKTKSFLDETKRLILNFL